LAKKLRLLPMNASKDEKFSFWIRQIKQLYERHGARADLPLWNGD
jgi:hypothetical protein